MKRDFRWYEVLCPAGLTWLVYSHRRNGETPIRAEGPTRAEAWRVAAPLAIAPGADHRAGPSDIGIRPTTGESGRCVID
jgi:hypothetical protein